jgi:hypothetical protein
VRGAPARCARTGGLEHALDGRDIETSGERAPEVSPFVGGHLAMARSPCGARTLELVVLHQALDRD